MKWMLVLALSMTMLWTTGCSRGFVIDADRIHCAGWVPIYPHPDDTAATKRQVLAHDEFGVASKCWAKPDPAPPKEP